MNEEVPCHGWKKRGRETNARWRDVGVRVSRSSFSLPIMEKVKKGARLRDFLIPATGHLLDKAIYFLCFVSWNGTHCFVDLYDYASREEFFLI